MPKWNTGRINLINYKLLNTWIKRADSIRKEKDYLKVIFYCELFPFENILRKLNSTNSSFIKDNVKEIHYEKITTYNGAYLQAYYEYNREIYKIFDYLAYWYRRGNYCSQLQIMGSFYRLAELWEFNRKEKKEEFILDLIENKNEDINNSKITRFDYAIDFIQEKSEKSSIGISQSIYKYQAWSKAKNSDKYNIIETNKDWWIKKYNWETIYNWSRDSRNLLIRCYDKLKEIAWKKNFLYADYNKFNNVIRLEFELLTKFIQNKSINQIWEVENKIYELLFWNYKGKIYEPTREVDFENWDLVQKRRYIFKTIKDIFKLINNQVWIAEELVWYIEDNVSGYESIPDVQKKFIKDYAKQIDKELINYFEKIIQNPTTIEEIRSSQENNKTDFLWFSNFQNPTTIEEIRSSQENNKTDFLWKRK
jgi:hypothetical protein